MYTGLSSPMLRRRRSTYSPGARSPAITTAGSPGSSRIATNRIRVMPSSTGPPSARRCRTCVSTEGTQPSLLDGRAEVHEEAGLVTDILDPLVPHLEIDELVEHRPGRVIHDEAGGLAVQRVTLRVIRL